jgi:cytochrome c biogenesis DsbD-like protein
MMRLGGAAALAVLLAASAAASGGQPGVVEILRSPAVELRAGARAVARVDLRVKSGYHVQANPVLDPALIPIALTMGHAEGFDLGAPRYPAAKRFRLQGAQDDLVVLDGTFFIAVPIRASREIGPGERTLKGTIRFQACDHEHCLFPRTLPVEIPVVVVSPVS